MAASAGLSVSELIAEKTVETAIVTANWRKNWPVMPLMNAHGTNTAHSTSATAMIGPVTSSIALTRGLARRQALAPASARRSPRTTMASSTTMPIASTRPNSEMLFRLKPERGHDGEGADDGDRHGDQRDQDHRPPVLQEDQHHDRHQDDGLEQRLARRRATDSRMNGVVS